METHNSSCFRRIKNSATKFNAVKYTKYRYVFLLSLCGLFFGLLYIDTGKITVFYLHAHPNMFTFLTDAAVSQNNHTSQIGGLGESSIVLNLKSYSYGVAQSDSKSVVSYTDKTVREIGQMVRVKLMIIYRFDPPKIFFSNPPTPHST